MATSTGVVLAENGNNQQQQTPNSTHTHWIDVEGAVDSSKPEFLNLCTKCAKPGTRKVPENWVNNNIYYNVYNVLILIFVINC